MEWQIVTIKNKDSDISPIVYIGGGCLEFNNFACEMIHDVGQYQYAQFLKSEVEGKSAIAIKFLCFYEDNSVCIARKNQDDKNSKRIIVNNPEVIEELFGKESQREEQKGYNVECISEDMLRILT